MAGKYVVRKTTNGQFHFNLTAGNGEVLLTSETYLTKAGAFNGIQSVRVNSPLDVRYDRRVSTAGKPYFNLKAANGEIIGNSEQYSSISARDAGIASAKVNGPSATVEDLT